jgi:hypothetical protein
MNPSTNSQAKSFVRINLISSPDSFPERHQKLNTVLMLISAKQPVTLNNGGNWTGRGVYGFILLEIGETDLLR